MKRHREVIMHLHHDNTNVLPNGNVLDQPRIKIKEKKNINRTEVIVERGKRKEIVNKFSDFFFFLLILIRFLQTQIISESIYSSLSLSLYRIRVEEEENAENDKDYRLKLQHTVS